jgi:hypothetical protein
MTEHFMLHIRRIPVVVVMPVVEVKYSVGKGLHSQPEWSVPHSGMCPFNVDVPLVFLRL